jgi:putative Ca2+/H+ antiporter (TMEM165/GDT1 family)
MQLSDFHTAVASFAGVMVAEVVVKPVAVRVGRWLLQSIDDRITIIPDWLSRPKKKCHED